jgi:hypothetical protein
LKGRKKTKKIVKRNEIKGSPVKHKNLTN